MGMEPFEPARTDQREVDVRVGRAWRDHRRHVLDIAFRMTGSLAEAEDVVQEAFTRLMKVNIDQIDDVRAWLAVVVTRLCLDSLRNSRRHLATHERTLDPSLAMPAQDPADRATLDDNIRVALHVVLNRLSPSERTVFVLHDVFQYRFDEIATIVGRTPAACRQLGSRARRAIAADADGARFEIQSPEQRAITQQFLEACSTGDLTALLALLDESVDGIADIGSGGGGGLESHGGIVTVQGAEAVAEAALRFLGPNSRSVLLSVPAGDRGQVVAVRDHQPVALVAIEIRAGLIRHIDAIADQDKLLPIASALGL
jgi:RNA polymerase sigma-70 factor, ECF subfamily